MFFVMYDKDTRTPVGISGSPFIDIGENCATAFVDEEAALSFLVGPRKLHDYFVVVKQGIGKFIPKGAEIINQSAKKIQRDNIIRDLDYRSLFFDRLFIEFVILDKEVILSLENSPEESIAYLETVTLNSILPCNLYFTEKYDPTKILSKTVFDIAKLSSQKIISLNINLGDVSIWGSKKTL